MTTPPVATPAAMAPTVPDSAPPARPTHPARFGLFFGIVASALTLAAIVLAVFAPQLTSAPKLQVPAGWQQVYSANPGDTAGVWNNATTYPGCSFPSRGLQIASEGTCEFQPSNGAALGGGVLIDAQLAPAAEVSASEDTGILLDNSLLVIITQQGDYEICHNSCVSPSSASDFQPAASGSTIAWHADSFVANEIAVLYNADQDTVAFYVNGQFVDQVSADISASPTVALTTSSTGEALFTHVTIYAGSPS